MVKYCIITGNEIIRKYGNTKKGKGHEIIMKYKQNSGNCVLLLKFDSCHIYVNRESNQLVLHEFLSNFRRKT